MMSLTWKYEMWSAAEDKQECYLNCLIFFHCSSSLYDYCDKQMLLNCQTVKENKRALNGIKGMKFPALVKYENSVSI